MSLIDCVLVAFHFYTLEIDLFVEFGHFLLEDLALVLLDGVEFGFLFRGFGFVDDPLETLVKGLDL